MKRSILISLLVIGAVATLVGAASWATFSDTETSEDNTIETGSLNLKVGTTTDGVCDTEYVDPWSGPFIDVSNVAPGDSGEVTICVENDGSIDGILDADVYDVTDTEIAPCPEPELTDPDETDCTPGADGELSENLLVDIWVDGNCDNVNSDSLLDGNPDPSTGDNWFFSDTLDGLAAFDFPEGDMTAESEWCYGVAWEVNFIAGNEVQTDKVTADVEFTLEQAP